jgi:aldose 1-epimerase
VKVVTLRNGSLHAEVLPEVGGALARFDWVGSGAPRAIFRACAMPPASPSQVACFAMLPWANRIAPGGFEFDGHAVSLSPNRDGEPCPIHGEGWRSAWVVHSQSPTDVRLTLDLRGGTPFAYEAVLHYSLLDTALQVTLEVRNCGARALPFGLGLHPWFARGAGARLHAPAATMWERGGLNLPGAQTALPASCDFNALQRLPEAGVDNVFGGWDGHAKICLPEQGIVLRIGSDMDYFILYAPEGADFFCFEPVDHLPNGQSAARGLAPGSTSRRTVAFAVEPQ